MKRIIAIMTAGFITLSCAPIANAQVYGTPQYTIVQSCTAAIAFGGASVGVTYTTNVCESYISGKSEYFRASIVLSSKGSSTGSATVTGIPVATLAGGGTQICTTTLFTVTLTGTAQSTVAPNTTTVALFNNSAGTGTALTDVQFSNTSNIYLSCMLDTN